MNARGGHHGRGGRGVLAGAAALGAIAVAATVALAALSKPIVVRDGTGDVTGPLDLQRVSLRRAADGRLRAALTVAAKVTPRTLLARSGPPGSVCLRVWTQRDADPSAQRPDRLVCVTASSAGELRGGVYQQRDAGLATRVGAASVRLNSSRRSFVVLVSQSALGRPQLIRVAAEATRPGCERTSCIDTAPDGGAVRRFRLR